MSGPVSWRSDFMALQHHLMSGRKRVKLTQEQAAERIGVSKATFVRWEHGNAEPSLMQLFRWADTVNVRIQSSAKVICPDNLETSA